MNIKQLVDFIRDHGIDAIPHYEAEAITCYTPFSDGFVVAEVIEANMQAVRDYLGY